jgi:hypothetical protein
MRQSYVKLENIPEVEENLMKTTEFDPSNGEPSTATSNPKALFESEFNI